MNAGVPDLEAQMKKFSIKGILAFVKKKKSIFIALGIAIVVVIGLSIASSIMGSSTISLKSELLELDEKTQIEMGTVSGGGRFSTGSTVKVKATPYTGYEFVAWVNDDEAKTLASNEAEYSFIVPEKSMTLTATWRPIEYTIDFHLDGSTTEYPVTSFVVTDSTIFLNEPVKEGYTFLGWYSDATFTTSVADYIEPSTAQSYTYYAKWARSYNIVYKLNPDDDPRAANAANPNNPSTYTKEADVALSAPICYEYKDGALTGGWFTFDHWEIEGQPGVAVTKIESTKLQESELTEITLVAKWGDLDKPIYYNPITENGITYIELGQYPSKRLSDRKVISELKAAIEGGLEPDETTGYYTFNNSIYARVTADLYSKPYDEKGKKNSSYVPYYFEDGTLIDEGAEYFFIVEPLKWRVLSGNPNDPNSELLLLCETVITACAFKQEETVLSVGGNTIYPNDWEQSEVRAFLNDEFYTKAFKSGEARFIQTTLVDYGAETTNPSYTDFVSEKGRSYECEDHVFLLSHSDLTNEEYGWTSKLTAEDDNKVAKATDYAKATGAYCGVNKLDKDSAIWWLRSAADFYYRSSVTTAFGAVGSTGVTTDYVGVRPAITVKLSK